MKLKNRNIGKTRLMNVPMALASRIMKFEKGGIV